ncbi:pre-mRNA 3' end processing protein WDR33 [Trichonephila inaurata madagascariensis]|uniref:Pre-mRNA 3' end processing protein WDR33 n=1 Tax=Trichonephila inaurata madagascariensis TaxID=2747483 RepID=A0A8X7CA85_9ARAC|nr:pre-mRNA 3' end processing protein WDR33 [Trichonephila inaurata madagascariensis]
MQATQISPVQRFPYVPKFLPPPNFPKPNHVAFTSHRQHLQQGAQVIEFDGKRLRKAVTRKTVDYNTSVIKHLEARVWQRDYRDKRAIQPDTAYYIEMTPPLSMPDNPINAVTTKFVRTSTNKMRCPIFCVAWTPEGRRLVTGASSGEFTLWNGLTFNFETILQAHDSPVRCMVWSHNDVWMVTGDHAGYVKYWQSNMNNVKMFQAHKEPLRGISFCPVDTKFVTCSDDGTVRIWDFLRCLEEKILRGHGADVKCVDWHPQKSLIVSGSKDSQQPIKLWDPKSGQSLATVHAHKNTVMDTKWNKNGNWLLTASRDHLIKLFDIRNMSQEMQTFRGHKKEATTLAWHPIHEGLFTSGGSDGCVMFWVVGADKEVGCMEQAHDSCVWSLAWHPLGHILCSGSNDHSSKFWTRNRPGDRMQDKYNLNTLPKGQEELAEYDDTGAISSIPGMGLEYGLPDHLKPSENSYESEIPMIPGLDFTSEDSSAEKSTTQKKIPFSKPIPKQFQQQWMESKQPLLLAPPPENDRSNGEIPGPPNPEGKPSQSLIMPPQEQHFQSNTRQGPPYIEPPPRPPQRSALLGERPKDSPVPPPSKSELHPSNRPPPNNIPFPENHENFSRDLPRNEPGSHDTWRTFPDEPMDIGPPRNENENGSLMQNPEARHGFESMNNVGPPHKRGRPERYSHMNEEDFIPENLPPRGGSSHFPGDNMRFSSNEMDPRNSHRGPDEMGFMGHKRSWNDGPLPPPHEEQFPPMMDFDGPDFNPRHSGNMFHRGRGPRGPFRGGRSPFRIINRGRGRGGYPS